MSNGMGSGGVDNLPCAQQAGATEKIRPSGMWYFLVVALLLAGLGGGGTMICQTMIGVVERHVATKEFRAPGEFEATFDKPGMHAIYLVGNRQRPGPEELAVTVTNKDDGEIVLEETHPIGSLTVNGEPYEQLYQFLLDKPATVVVHTQTGNDPEASLKLPATVTPVTAADRKQIGNSSGYAPRLAVGPECTASSLLGRIAKIFLGVGLAAVGTLAAIAIFVVVLIKRGNCKTRMARGMTR